LHAPRILLISGNFPPSACGVGDYTHRLATALSQTGLDVQLLTTAGPVLADAAGVNVRASVRSWNLFRVAEVLKEIRAAKPDIVHVQYPTAAYGMGLLPQALALSRIPFVVTIHEASYAHVLRKLSLYPFLVFADHVVATTQFEASFLARMYPPAHKKLSVIPLGSNVPVEQARSRDMGTVVYFGLIAPRKGLEDFLTLAGLAGGSGESWTFRVVGMPPPRWEPYARELRDASLSLPVEWCLSLPPEKVSEHLAGAGAVYLPFPDGAALRRGSLIAALANGSPVITTHGDASPDDLTDGEKVVYADSPEVAFKAVKRITSDPEFGRRLSLEAAGYGERFSWPEIADRHAALYEGVVGERRA
jgi:glycosyltransferase involved in cell wall biosynthesis